ncbi:rolling circle replication-associated protein [Photobacterium makurazakiensis]|uniref:rolling circle replication-associated protein n=1 Tax=Photobacterium makurazakiensis TaxID=2910234 RepID=UPI003D116A3A
MAKLCRAQRGSVVLDSTEAFYNHDSMYAITDSGNNARVLPPKGKSIVAEPEVTPNSIRLMKRDWSGGFKIQYYTQTPSSSAPDAQEGDRFTEKLTKRSVLKIFESGAYVATCCGGFVTFLTLTFSNEQRHKIFGGMVEGDAAPYCTLPEPPLPASKTRGARSMLRGRPKIKCTDGSNTPINIKRNMAKSIDHIAGPYCYIDTCADDPAATVDIHNDGSVKVMNENGNIAGPYTPTFSKPEKEFTLTKTAETTIGKEVSRFLDGAKKMYHRGWVANHTVEVDAESGAEYCKLEEKSIAGYTKASDVGPTQESSDFHYIWVAECPANENGEPNPHVHVLLNWSVPKPQFSAWSKRLEKLWGNGFANLQRIQQPKAASSYIIKAVGYAAKGGNADQGLIKGNRYNIARCSRAPAWECVASFEADNMAAIIKECGYKLEQWRKPLNRRIRRIEKQLDQTIKAKSIAKQARKPEDVIHKLTGRIIRLEHQIRSTREQIKKRDVYATTKNIFSMSFDGNQAEEKVWDFLLWAAGARGWSMESRSGDETFLNMMVEAKETACAEYEQNYHKFREKRAYWQSVLNDPFGRRDDGDQDAELAWSMCMREQYISDNAHHA